MKIHVRFFGFSADMTGCAEWDVTLHEEGTIQTVLEKARLQFPRLAEARSVIKFARNTDYADPHTPVRDGDTISFIPPVAGG